MKIFKKILIGIVGAIVVLFCVFQWFVSSITSIDEPNIKIKRAYWQTVIDKEIPIGTSKEKLKKWCKKRGFYWDDFDRGNGKFDVTIDNIPSHFLTTIEILEVEIGNKGTIVARHLITARG